MSEQFIDMLEAVQRPQVARLQVEVERLTAELEAERARNAPLRARIKVIQDRHDQELAPLRKRIAYFEDVWQRAAACLQWTEEGRCVIFPSATERAAWGMVTAERDRLAASLEVMRSALAEVVRTADNSGGWHAHVERYRALLATAPDALGAAILAAAETPADAIPGSGVRDGLRACGASSCEHPACDLLRALRRWRALTGRPRAGREVQP